MRAEEVKKKELYICNEIILLLLLKSIVPKCEAISEAGKAKSGSLGNGEGIGVGLFLSLVLSSPFFSPAQGDLKKQIRAWAN